MDVWGTVVKPALTIGIPISVGFLVYQLSPFYGDLSEDEKADVVIAREATGTIVSASTLAVLGSAAAMLWLLGDD